MLWRLTLAFSAGISLSGAILPEKFGNWTRTGAVEPVAPPDPALWTEHGFLAAESAGFRRGGRPAKLTIYRMKDPTGGLAAYQELRTPGPSLQLGKMASAKPEGALVLLGNYVVEWIPTPKPSDLSDLTSSLSKVDRSSLPALPGRLPQRDRVAASDRSILGPAALARLAPGIPAKAARFDLGAEAQFARYSISGAESQLIVFSYPTPQIARVQRDVLAQLGGWAVHRAGPLVALAPLASGSAAERLTQSVEYSPSLMWNEQPIKPQGNPGDMLLAIVILAGVLIALSVLFGVLFGGSRVILRRFGIESADASLTSLNLSRD